MKTKTTLQKIEEAKSIIRNTEVKKAGRNDYSGYDYFTPEQIEQLVSDATGELKLFIKFDLQRDELGISGKLTAINLEDEEDIIFFVMASAIPEITATNIAQQLGGAMTYTKRYMLMNTFDITDNNADFDTSQNTKKTEEAKIVWLTKEQFEAAIKSDLKGIQATLKKYNTTTHKAKKDFITQLKEREKELIFEEETT